METDQSHPKKNLKEIEDKSNSERKKQTKTIY